MSFASAIALLVCGAVLSIGATTSSVSASRSVSELVPEQDTSAPSTEGCLTCHVGIEAMHPEAKLSCVACHGGNDRTKKKSEAHVASIVSETPDERVPPIDEDLAYRRFKNPMDLRVAQQVCGPCHETLVKHLAVSLHGTTAGHLSDGYYEMGVLPKRGAAFSVFPTTAIKNSKSEYESFQQVPAFKARAGSGELAVHYTDLARKECLQCHLWSQGRAVRGRVGFDGDYRGEGCASCHVEYALDGLSRSGDKAANRTEPGHAKQHALQRSPTTQTCTSCHYGDASIGLNFRGLAQLPPGAPGGPEIPGTTSQPLNRQFYMSDPATNPPDVHHERGMHCIDCHTTSDVMGDGQLHGSMEHAVEISCSDCHGTFAAESTLTTQRGNRLTNLRRDGDRVILQSKVTGEDHVVVQVKDVLDPKSSHFNPRAARAMTAQHANVECYTCHAGWNPNFLGFHFDRNESLSQLDLLTGRRTEGRVTTQEKVFTTFKSLYAGLNERGAVAPYTTGFSTMGSVTDAKGERILDQVLPVTSAGLSGMTMIHHQMHTTRKTARSCVECHRTSTTWGLGSTNFQIARQLAFVADRRGIEVIALNRSQIATSVPLTKFVLPDVTALEIRSDPSRGSARELFAAEGGRGIHVIDVREPTTPKRIAFAETIEPHGLALRGDWLYVADGPGGLCIFDVAEPAAIKLVGRVPMCDARAVSVQWPYAYVADGVGGLAIVDVHVPFAAKVVGGAMLPAEDGSPGNAIEAQTLFQYSRPRTKRDKSGVETLLAERTTARNVCAVLDEDRGLILVDVTEPTRARQIYPEPPRKPRSRPSRAGLNGFRGLALQSHVDLGEPQGGTKTAERDYAYVLVERLNGNNRTSFVEIYDITDPMRPKKTGQSASGQSSEGLVLGAFYNAPFLQTMLFACGEDGVFATDATVSSQPNQLGALTAMRQSYVMAIESFPLDRMLDERGRALKDVSHEGSRWMYLAEIDRVLSVSAEKLGLVDPKDKRTDSKLALARLEFAQRDTDRSCFLDGSEIGPGAQQADTNGDGRVSLVEFARANHVFQDVVESTNVAAETLHYRASRVDPDGDLARLFDGIDPQRFDVNGDARLDRNEMSAALFATLDLDLDRRLTISEMSRHPGELRRLRYGDPAAKAVFDALDANHDGHIGLTELRVRDEEWAALDADHDGFVQLPVAQGSKVAKTGKIVLRSEWPTRYVFKMHLPPDATVERMLAQFDKDGDKILSRRELENRLDLLYDMDDGQNGQVDFNELKLRCAVLADAGVDVARDGFLERWDLNGDGKVDTTELPIAAWLRARILPH